MPHKLNLKYSLNLFFAIIYWLRVQHLYTYLFLKKEYQRSLRYIQIDITYMCNLNCINCNRSCGKAINEESLSVAQIKKFIDESINKQIFWERIDILGGEPTLYTELIEILELLAQYKKNYSSSTIIQVVTNGRGNAKILEKIPSDIAIYNSHLQNKNKLSHPFNVAPIDKFFYKNSDFTNGCWITQNCGIGLNKYGYYPCAVAAGIDRVFGFNKGRKTLPDETDLMLDLLNLFCRYCGHFIYSDGTQKEQITSTWDKAYHNYSKIKPKLTEY